jgi:tetrahydromethanopterin S-methyltransferase subunit F
MDMRWQALAVGFVLSFVLLALPRASYACPA